MIVHVRARACMFVHVCMRAGSGYRGGWRWNKVKGRNGRVLCVAFNVWVGRTEGKYVCTPVNESLQTLHIPATIVLFSLHPASHPIFDGGVAIHSIFGAEIVFYCTVNISDKNMLLVILVELRMLQT